MHSRFLIVIALGACNIGPQVSDTRADAPVVPDVAPATNLLPAGAPVPSISDNTELINQIRLNDGLSDSALAASNGVVTRGTGKSGGVTTVRYWNFGPVPTEGTIAVVAPIYVFGTLDASSGAFTPLPNHPPLIDTICGDTRYSPIRRVYNVAVTATYAGEEITSMPALAEALDRGLVTDPVADGTWANMPVVLPGTTLEVGDPMMYPPVPSTHVYVRGYVGDVLVMGTMFGRQPLRNAQVPIGQDSGLQSGVATGVPPILSTAIDPSPVFQYTIPTAAPTTTPNYSPLCTDVTVRLADGIAPSAIASDTDLFKRSSSGAITGYRSDNVASYTVSTTTNNLQLQFAEGSP